MWTHNGAVFCCGAEKQAIAAQLEEAEFLTPLRRGLSSGDFDLPFPLQYIPAGGISGERMEKQAVAVKTIPYSRECLLTFVGALQDEEPSVRVAAATGLGDIQHDDARPVLKHLCLALRDTEHKVREGAANAIAKLDAPIIVSALPFLLPLLRVCFPTLAKS